VCAGYAILATDERRIAHDEIRRWPLGLFYIGVLEYWNARAVVGNILPGGGMLLCRHAIPLCDRISLLIE
jgi:hypothetical protein